MHPPATPSIPATSSPEQQTPRAPRLFPQTHWSQVFVATGKGGGAAAADTRAAAQALESLCRAYWNPLYIYARRCGHSPHDAQDLTQEFFSRLLAKRWLDSADPQKGRLRTFLVVALKNFMAKEWRREHAQRRGGGQSRIAFDTAFGESALAADPAPALPPDADFDRQWAMTLLDLTLTRLRDEFAKSGRPDDFEILKTSLAATHGNMDYPAMAARLGATTGATRVAVHRLRKRFREIYREEISRTLTDHSDIDAELRHLAAALSR